MTSAATRSVADLAIRGGTVVDGSGRPPYRADVSVKDGLISFVGDEIGPAYRELDAEGLLVTPGFVDPHTHFDGQATWDPMLAPSSLHGVTTIAMGNCGVGFAPAASDRHDWLIGLMEGVEDIPGSALAEGLRWDWESFPEFMDSLDRQRRAIDVGAHMPHAPLRAFVMGDRGADPSAKPTEDELERMVQLVDEAIEAGAIGISTSRTAAHRTRYGDNLGTLRASRDELVALASALRRRSSGVVQLISDCYRTPDDAFARDELNLIADIARASRRPVSFTTQQALEAPERWRDLIRHAETLQALGLNVKAQVAPRPIGVLFGAETTTNPFALCRAYRQVAHLPLPERLAALREPERRRRILDGHTALTSGSDAFAGLAFLARYDDMFVLSDPVDYALRAGESLGHRALTAGIEPAAAVYDTLFGGDGTDLVYVPLFNFADGNLDAVREMIASPVSMFGLSDAGAHCGAICDASMTTSYLALWARDLTDGPGLPVEEVVRRITRQPAEHIGWLDRGLVRPGYLADLNVIDLDELGCASPRVVHDLPAGGRRLVQDAMGYRWTIKRGSVTFDNGEHTGDLPGELVRGPRTDPGNKV